ncbi:MAG TPA: heme o synthase [Vicinamibacteria bacterium]|nr:heme o synthase [Vicinamibacteria bacterium]
MSSPALAASRASAADFLELTKPRITLLVVFTALVGFVMASPGPVSAAALTPVLLGVALVAGGASALNMLLERDTDALMQRTRPRPLPAGRLRPAEALLFGLALSGLGLGTLAWLSGGLCAAVALVTWASYLFVYTPLKRRTSLSTLVGAVPGALPPVIGWAAARAALEPGAYVLFAILFLWQVPHTLAIAWIYRDDYARGGLPVLPVLDPEGHLTGRQTVVHSLALFLVSLAPAAAGLAGSLYLAGAVALGALLLGFAVRLAVVRSLAAARGLFLASVAYLPALFLLLLVDRR